MRGVAIGMVAALAATPALAQQLPAPTDNDLHAAYCSEATRLALEVVDKALAAAPADDPAAPRVRQARTLIAHNHDRFLTYAALAMARDDPTGMALAMARADDDWKQTVEGRVAPQAPDCRDLSWLPL